MANTVVFTKQLDAASANSIALSQSPGTAAFTLNGAAVAGGVATIDEVDANNMAAGVRVTITSGGNDSSITFLITGTNSSGNIVTDTVTGTNAGVAQSNLDFVTVTNIIATGVGAASTVTAGNGSVGSSSWLTWNYMGKPPMNLGIAVELVSGAVNYTVQYTYDDPNNLPAGVNFPLAFSSALLNLAATTDGTISTPFVATRVLINSGTGVIRCRFVQAGIG